MLIFVKSAGDLRKFDYVWVGQDTKEDSSEKLNETGIKQRIPKEIWGLVSTDERSLLFFQSHESSCLLLTKLASKRQDFASRRISSAVGFFSQEIEERVKLRKFFTSFLVNPAEIQNKIDDLILGSTDEPGFKFFVYQLEELIDQNLDVQISGDQVNLEVGYVLPDLPNSYREIAAQMFAIDEKKVGPIFLFREYEDEKFFHAKKVWRGISKMVKIKTEAYDICSSSSDLPTTVSSSQDSESSNQLLRKLKDVPKLGGEILKTRILNPVTGFFDFKLWIHYKENDPQRARQHLEKAAKARMKKAMLELASIFDKEGKIVEAIKWFKLTKELHAEIDPQKESRCKELEAQITDDQKRQIEEFVKNELNKKGGDVFA